LPKKDLLKKLGLPKLELAAKKKPEQKVKAGRVNCTKEGNKGSGDKDNATT
jgi:hypothetical protein